MTAVLDRPHQLGPEAFLSPSDRLVMPLGHGLDRDLPELAAGLIDRHERVGALVHVGADNNHGGCLLHLISDWTVGPAGGHISVGAVPRSYQVTPAGSLTPSAGTTHARQPEDDTEAMSQTPGDRDPTTATRAATLTLTLRTRPVTKLPTASAARSPRLSAAPDVSAAPAPVTRSRSPPTSPGSTDQSTLVSSRSRPATTASTICGTWSTSAAPMKAPAATTTANRTSRMSRATTASGMRVARSRAATGSSSAAGKSASTKGVRTRLTWLAT